MPRCIALALLVGLACGGSTAPTESRESALERLRQSCPDYYAASTPEQRMHVVNRVIASSYPECVVLFSLGEPQARRLVPDDSGAEWWYYDRDPGYLQLTVEGGLLRSWTRCGSCKRWYEN